MKKIALSALAVAALAGSAMAQDPNFRLDLSLVARSGDNVVGLEDMVGSPTINVGDKLNIEVRYRIVDLNTGDTQTSRGLNSLVFNVVSNSSGMLSAAALTDHQAFTGGLPLNPDDSGDSFGEFGLHAKFDTARAIPGAIGTPAGGILQNVVALNTSNPDHRSNIVASSQGWGIFSFIFEPTSAGEFNFGLDFAEGWSFWRRTGTTIETNPVTQSANQSTVSGLRVTVVPAPGAAALLGLGGLIAARRRRA